MHSPFSPVTAMVELWLRFGQMSKGKPYSISVHVLFCIPLTSCSKGSLVLQHGIFLGLSLALMHVQIVPAHGVILYQWQQSKWKMIYPLVP